MSDTVSISRAGAVVEDFRHRAILFEDVAIAFEDKQVLNGISFELARGESKILLGVAGSGKSTILKMALGLVKPDRGSINVLGYDVTSMREEELFDLRRKVGIVFQESALFDSLTVEENVAYRLIEEGYIPADEIRQRVIEALRFVELEHTLDLLPAELSGGMRRRVAIARAIITQPDVLLYDSPTAGLDPITSTRIIELIVKQRDVYKTSALLVTHRLQDAFIMASSYFDTETNQMLPVAEGSKRDVHTTFLILRDGKVLFDGTAIELAHSDDEYIREYIA
ncbi:MAG TPA: ATP-binding cassette domain-containing protein [Terriglobales bacterium]|nr:ATP-binding cassette domain-containing protein [Terriglobales bacterium]